MKKLMASIVFFAFSITLVLAQTPQPSNGSVLIQTSKPSTDVILRTWVLVITSQTTKHSLDSVSAAWKKDSIILRFSELQINDKGKLMAVSGFVKFMSKEKPVSGKFTRDSVYPRPLEIKMDDRPSVSIKNL